ncbi:hypothetical protein P7K49_036880, partial [Saguinus oedipus]
RAVWPGDNHIVWGWLPGQAQGLMIDRSGGAKRPQEIRSAESQGSVDLQETRSRLG